MAYSSITKPSLHFNTKTYSGTTNSSDALTGIGFQPDLVWLKSRSNAAWHIWTDSVRGVDSQIYSNSNSVAGSLTNYLESFDSDGFTINNNTDINGSGKTFVGWSWKGGNSAGSSNTDGDITSTVSVNTTAGFSICKWSGSGSAGTIGHGLGAVPKMIIAKRIIGGVRNFPIYHSALGNDKKMYLNDSQAESSSTNWNSTTPTNQVFSIGSADDINGSGSTYIAYCFAEKKGYSKFGSYTGNGNADGTFIYTGFKPAFFLAKETTTSNWFIKDNKRLTSFNPSNGHLYPNLNNVEEDYADFDFLSNGIKIRHNGTDVNESGVTYIYMAFAEAPLVGSNNVPCTAR